jgi:hypothetical protein
MTLIFIRIWSHFRIRGKVSSWITKSESSYRRSSELSNASTKYEIGPILPITRIFYLRGRWNRQRHVPWWWRWTFSLPNFHGTILSGASRHYERNISLKGNWKVEYVSFFSQFFMKYSLSLFFKYIFPDIVYMVILIIVFYLTILLRFPFISSSVACLLFIYC